MGRDLTPSLATLGKERGTRPKGCGEGRWGIAAVVLKSATATRDAAEVVEAVEPADRRGEQVEVRA
jgi:hypothetical protein